MSDPRTDPPPSRSWLEWIPSDETYRPCLWIRYRTGYIVIFLGWQWPPHVMRLR
jgi:hypothetical protein